MRFLLDENFPLQLYRQLQARGIDCEHIVVLGQHYLKTMLSTEVVVRQLLSEGHVSDR